MISHQRVEELSDRLLAEGALGDDETTELRSALAESDAARVLYLQRCELNLALGDSAALGLLADSSPLPPPSGIRTASEQAPAQRDRRPLSPAFQPERGPARRSIPWTGIGIAALVMVGSMAWWLVEQTRNGPGPASNQVGTVLRTMGESPEWSLGQTLSPGEHAVANYRVEFRLSQGVVVAVQGPARFSFVGANHMQLAAGRMSARVPNGAEGFRVDANDVEVIDLGTQFAVTANVKGDTAVHVYEGKVTAGETADRGKAPEVLDSGATIRRNLETGSLDRVSFSPELFASSPTSASSIDWHGPDMNVLESAPKFISPTSHPGSVLVFREQSRIELSEELALDITPSASGPTIAAGDESNGGSVTAGRKVSSYLVQFTPAGEETPSKQALIRFDSRILGLVCAEESLAATDVQLGAPGCEIHGWDKVSRGLESEDHIELMSDGRTIHILLSAPPSHGDQLRVIVADD